MERQGRHGHERDGGVRRQRDNWLVRAESSTSRAWVKEGLAEIEAGMQGGTAREKKVKKKGEDRWKKKEKEEGNSIVRRSLGGGGADKRTEIITVCRLSDHTW